MRIIAVESEQIELFSLAKAIQKAVPDAELKCFLSSGEALEYSAEHFVDVAFLEMMMPKMHGLVLGKYLRELHPNVNIIFLSDTNEYAMQAWDLHASGYVTKPISAEKIASELGHLRYFCRRS